MVNAMVVICSVLAASLPVPLPDWMLYECRSIRKGGELIIQLTEVFLWWLSSRGAGGGSCTRGLLGPRADVCACVRAQGVRGGGGVIKLSASLPGMTLLRLDGATERQREEGGGRSATNIRVCALLCLCVRARERAQC